jgi:hypothetical protein
MKLNINSLINSVRSTPWLLIQHGLKQWEEHLKDRAVEMQATTAGSMLQMDVLLTQAYRAPSYEIGWEMFLRGGISKYWDCC